MHGMLRTQWRQMVVIGVAAEHAGYLVSLPVHSCPVGPKLLNSQAAAGGAALATAGGAHRANATTDH